MSKFRIEVADNIYKVDAGTFEQAVDILIERIFEHEHRLIYSELDDQEYENKDFSDPIYIRENERVLTRIKNYSFLLLQN